MLNVYIIIFCGIIIQADIDMVVQLKIVRLYEKISPKCKAILFRVGFHFRINRR